MNKKKKIITCVTICLLFLFIIYILLCIWVLNFSKWLINGINENGGAWTLQAKEQYGTYVINEQIANGIAFRGPNEIYNETSKSYEEWISSWYDEYDVNSFKVVWCFNKAYVWYEYTSEVYDSTTDELILGGYNIRCKITLEFSNGIWIVTDYFEFS